MPTSKPRISGATEKEGVTAWMLPAWRCRETQGRQGRANAGTDLFLAALPGALSLIESESPHHPISYSGYFSFSGDLVRLDDAAAGADYFGGWAFGPARL